MATAQVSAAAVDEFPAPQGLLSSAAPLAGEAALAGP
jgi:hypothetical protein